MRQIAALTAAFIALSSASSAQATSLYRDEHWSLTLDEDGPLPMCMLTAMAAANGDPRRMLIVYISGKANIARIEVSYPPQQYLAPDRPSTVAVELGTTFSRSMKFRRLLNSMYPIIAARLTLSELEDIRLSLDGATGEMSLRFENGETWRFPPPQDRKLASAAADCWKSAVLTDAPPSQDDDVMRCEPHLSGCADAVPSGQPSFAGPLTTLSRLFVDLVRVQYLYSRGNDHLNKDEYDRAIEYYDRAIQIRSGFEPVFNQRGLAYLRSKRYDRAFGDFDRATRLNPTYAVGFSNRGLVYNQRREYHRAVRDFDRAIRLDPTNWQSYRGRGIAKHSLGDIPGGDVDLQKALDLLPRRP